VTWKTFENCDFTQVWNKIFIYPLKNKDLTRSGYFFYKMAGSLRSRFTHAPERDGSDKNVNRITFGEEHA
jgi:hypothetical protein